jgi:hypothetical protein
MVSDTILSISRQDGGDSCYATDPAAFFGKCKKKSIIPTPAAVHGGWRFVNGAK